MSDTRIEFPGASVEFSGEGVTYIEEFTREGAKNSRRVKVHFMSVNYTGDDGSSGSVTWERGDKWIHRATWNDPKLENEQRTVRKNAQSAIAAALGRDPQIVNRGRLERAKHNAAKSEREITGLEESLAKRRSELAAHEATIARLEAEIERNGG